MTERSWVQILPCAGFLISYLSCQQYVLNYGPLRSYNTTDFPKNMLSRAAWGQSSLICTDWAKKLYLTFWTDLMNKVVLSTLVPDFPWIFWICRSLRAASATALTRWTWRRSDASRAGDADSKCWMHFAGELNPRPAILIQDLGRAPKAWDP